MTLDGPRYVFNAKMTLDGSGCTCSATMTLEGSNCFFSATMNDNRWMLSGVIISSLLWSVRSAALEPFGITRGEPAP